MRKTKKNKNKNLDHAHTIAEDVELAKKYNIDNYNFDNFGNETGNKNGNGKTKISVTIPKPRIENGPKDDNLSTTNSLSKNSAGSEFPNQVTGANTIPTVHRVL